MTYIKLLTVLAGLALLTACGGAAAPKTDNTSGDTNTGEVNTTDCTATPFDTNCDAVESAITSRQTTCFASATANRRCGVVIAGACVANPFRAETACMADTYLPARIAECIKGGEADEGKCATITTDAEKNTMLTSCLKNPFDIVCKMTVADFATYTDTARMNRLDFCDDNANVANTLCTDNNVVIICGIDPFNAICFTGDTYLSPRITDCIKAENTEAEKCNTLLSDSTMNTAITACLTNPFTPSCEASESAFNTHANTARMNRESFCDMAGNDTKAFCMGENLMGVCELDPVNAICTDAIYLSAQISPCAIRANAGEPACENVLTRPNAATWLQSFTTELGAVRTVGDQFLQGTADGISGIGNTIPIILNLKTATYDDVAFDGDAEDGVAFFRGVIGVNAYNYAGIFSGTNLGAPITGTTGQTATWNGRIAGRGNLTVDSDFNLTVTFGGTGDIAGTLTAFAPATDVINAQASYYDINAEFNDKGVIIATEGNITYDIFTTRVSNAPDNSSDRASGTLTGLIGQEGAVGVFLLKQITGDATYVGGFVADNPDN